MTETKHEADAKEQRFEELGRTPLHFGKFKGKTLAGLWESDEGLSYLDWLLGQDWLYEDFQERLEEFCKIERVAKEIERVTQ